MGDGALGFWGALRQVFPATREQRCLQDRQRHLGSAQRLHADAKAALAAIYTAEVRAAALDAAGRSRRTVRRPPQGGRVDKITGDLDVLLALYDFPAAHHKHLRTTNAIGEEQNLSRGVAA